LYANRIAIGVLDLLENYWTSTESNASNALLFSDSEGMDFPDMKNSDYPAVRAVRSF